jgi:hypothetical protein
VRGNRQAFGACGEVGELALRGLEKGPYFYVAKMESHFEAMLWNEAFVLEQDTLGILQASAPDRDNPGRSRDRGRPLRAADHSPDVIPAGGTIYFPSSKRFLIPGADVVLPGRNSVTMTAPIMRAYIELLVTTCHACGADAIDGGLSSSRVGATRWSTRRRWRRCGMIRLAGTV